MRLRILPEARKEILDAIAYFRAKSPGLKRLFVQDLQLAIRSILEVPKAWTPFGPSMRKRNLYKFHYGIVYFLEGDSIIVVTFINLRGDPDHWRIRPDDR